MIDHSTCGHINHKTLDGSRHEEIHTALLMFTQRWYSAANRARAYGHDAKAEAYTEIMDDFVESVRGFEVEQ